MNQQYSSCGLHHYWKGERLKASCVAASQADSALVDLIMRSLLGAMTHQQLVDSEEWVTLPAYRDFSQNALLSGSEKSWRLYLHDPFFVDALLFWFFRANSSTAVSIKSFTDRFCRLCILLHHYFPKRPDLLYGLFADPRISHLRANAFGPRLRPDMLYALHEPLLQYSHQLWIKGSYEQLHLDYLSFQLDGRSVPVSDFNLRILTILGESDRLNSLFAMLYWRHRDGIPASSLSNLLFISLGQKKLDEAYVSSLVLSLRAAFPPQHAPPLPPKLPLRIDEKPLVAIVSADLRQHPVGRFWKPLIPSLAREFRLIHVFLNGSEGDGITAEIKSQSFDWLRIPPAEQPHLPARLASLRPHLAIDLGGHTADNQHGWLHYRVAPVQASYLGFYGPTYARECDWWITDRYLGAYISNSYPGSEPQWVCGFPSLCYDVNAHGLPAIDDVRFCASRAWTFGSFNHTRKLSSETIRRFGFLLKSIPEAILVIRSFSFYDTAVRRWFLQKFVDAGASPSQLLPLPFAPTASDAMFDYGRIHLHLDSFPVSGTTTTLDSLAMGVPVLTQPTNLYAGSISAALLDAVGLSEGIVTCENQLVPQSLNLLRKYQQASARSSLARAIRRSVLCDVEKMPKLFASELKQMIRTAAI